MNFNFARSINASIISDDVILGPWKWGFPYHLIPGAGAEDWKFLLVLELSLIITQVHP